MLKRISQVFTKLKFCASITADLPSFLRLLHASKSFSRFREKKGIGDTLDNYRLRIGDKIVPITMRRHSGDLDIFYETFLNRTYDFQGMGTLNACSVLDIGAHAGLASAFFYGYYPDAIFYCVEPDPENLALLRENLKSLIPADRLHIVPFALGEASGTGRVMLSRYSYNSTVIKDDTGPMVAIRTMREILQLLGIRGADIVKIDIEGAEDSLFENTSWMDHVQVVWIELHADREKARIMEAFTNKGFITEVHEDNPDLILARRSAFE